ncbi:MAG: sulfotransferase family protein [Methylococcales bacterium]
MKFDLSESTTHQIINIRNIPGGILYAESAGNEPYFLINSGDFTRYYIHVSMKIENAKVPDTEYLHCKLYFREKGMTRFDEAHSLSEAIKGIGEFYIYRFKCLPFQLKEISEIRFDPINCRADITIDEFTLRSYREDSDEVLTTEANKLDLLLLSYYSRSGSTLLMKMLTKHPAITGYTKGTHDSHIIKYFTRFYYMIKTSHIYINDHSRGSMIHRLNLLADHYSPESVLPKPLEFSQHINLSIFREHYSNFLGGYLPHLVRNLDMPDPLTAKYYVEKHMDGKSFGLLKAMFELFPRGKIIMLFRDPRDVYMSYLSFGQREHIIRMKGKIEAKIKKIMVHYSKRLELYEEYKDITHIVRYEDLLMTPNKTIQNILAFLSLEVDGEVIKDMLEPLYGNDLQAKRHITADSVNESVGRWKFEMSESEKTFFRSFNGIINRLGYTGN